MHQEILKRLHFYSTFNPFVKSFIICDGLLFSAWSLIFPLFAVFVTTDIPGGNIQIAAWSVTTYFCVRIVTEIFAGKYLPKLAEIKKINYLIFGMFLVSVAYVGFAFTTSVLFVFLMWSLAGIGWGLSTPTRLSLFSIHLDKDKEVTEWSVTDIINLILIALSTALGGFVATHYGFKTLFLLSSIINLLAIIPFTAYKKLVKE